MQHIFGASIKIKLRNRQVVCILFNFFYVTSWTSAKAHSNVYKPTVYTKQPQCTQGVYQKNEQVQDTNKVIRANTIKP